MINTKVISKKTLAAILATSMVLGIAFPSAAADTVYSYDAPKNSMAVDEKDVNGDGTPDKIITATAHRAASPVIDMLGCNAKSGFGMINGGAPTTLADAETRAALGIWGTSLNDNPDPYYWNYFYNFYAAASSLPTSDNALVNTSISANPAQADGTLLEEYGNVSVSLSTRPEIIVGCMKQGGAADDTTGYDAQLATIHSFGIDSEYYQEGDENYQPKLVSYQMTRITDMIGSIYRLADAMDEITTETGEIGRYGDAQTIASDYEKYVDATSAYILAEIAKGNATKKTVAIVSAVNTDDNGTSEDATDDTVTYTLSESQSMSATSSVRYAEYVALVSDNLANKLNKTTVTAEELAQADAIITTSTNINSDTLSKAVEAYRTSVPMIITTSPTSLYGITMNSVENAMGLGYFVAYLYSDQVEMNPVDMCAYFYQKFYHISDLNSLKKIVQVNFQDVVLPEGMTADLNGYSADKVESWLVKGMDYYEAVPSAFADTYIATAATKDATTIGWTIDWTKGIGSASTHSQTITGTSSYSKYCGDTAFTLDTKSSLGTALTYTSSNTKVATVDKTTGKVTIVGEGTTNIIVNAAAVGQYPTASKVVKVTVSKKAQTISNINNSYTKTYKSGDTFTLAAKASGKGTITYTSSKTSVATVGKTTGKVTIKGAGTATITISAAATGNYKAATKKITITVNKATQSISKVSSSYTKTYKSGSTFTLKASAKGSVTYTSSKTSVATVGKTTGKVTLKGVGTTTITVSAAATGNYKAATKKITLKVTKGTQTIKTKVSSKSYKASSLKSKSASFTIGASASGKVTYKVASGSKYISVSKAGKVTIKKGTPKGTYKVTVSAAATSKYNKTTKTVKITVK